MGRSERRVLLVTLIYIGVAAAVSWRASNSEFLLYIAVMVVLAGLVLLLHRRVQLHIATLWGLSLWGLAHMAGGLWRVSEAVGVLYNWRPFAAGPKYDQVVHAYGFGLCTWITWQAIRPALAHPERPPSFGVLSLCALGGMGLGAVNEVVEFVAVLTIPDTNVGGYVNTGWDLVSNAVGAVTAAVAIRLLWRRTPGPR